MSGEVALFVTCLVENMRPAIAFDSIALLEDAGFAVVVPGAQVCCGQPNYNGGDPEGAKQTARHVIDTFAPYEHVVVPSGSCGGMLKHHYPQLLADDRAYGKKAQDLAERVFELSQFLKRVGYRARPGAARQATYHDACAGLRELGIKSEPRELLLNAGVALRELKDSESCCGFGGTFCVKYPEVSNAMLERKLEDISSQETDLVALGDLGCLLNIEGGLSRAELPINVRHFAEILAEPLKSDTGSGIEATKVPDNTSQGQDS